MSIITPPSSTRYQDFLRDIKTQVAQSRLGAARAVNRSLIGLYWALGRMIVESQEELGWGSAVVDQLSADLRNEFPDMSGFSPRNLWYFKRFYETYSAAPLILQQIVAELPWGQNILNFSANKRLPEDFMCQLTAADKTEVVANCDHLAKLKYSPNTKRNTPFVLRRGKKNDASPLGF